MRKGFMSVDENDLDVEIDQGDRVSWATQRGDIGQGTVLDQFDDHLIIIMRDVETGEVAPIVAAPKNILTKLEE